MKKLMVMLIVCGSFVSCSCESERSPLTPAPISEKCTPNLAYCDGNTAKICNEHGRVAERTKCQENEVCLAGACDVNIVCSANQSVCVQNVLKTCNAQGTELTVIGDCGNDVCVNGACVSYTDTCPPNVDYCVDNVAYHCNAQGTGLTMEPMDCDGGLCVNGWCEALVCAPNVASCADQLAQTCNALGTGYANQELCTPPSSCVLGRCQELVCQPGTHCVGTLKVTCNEEGTQITEQEDCAPGSCSGGRCVSQDAGGPDRFSPNPDSGLPDNRRYDTGPWPDAVRPDHWQSDIVALDLFRPDAVRPDATRPDAWQTDGRRPDAGGPDGYRPDATTVSCSNDLNCGGQQYCHPNLGTCLDLPQDYCDTASDCPYLLVPKECDPYTRTCIMSCFEQVLCLDILNGIRNWCIGQGCYQCRTNQDCPGVRCDPFDQMCIPCSGNQDCLTSGWYCDQGTGACSECLEHSHCSGDDKCHPDDLECVECLQHSDCNDPNLPDCGKDNTCIPPCTEECAPLDSYKCDPNDYIEPISQVKCGDFDNDHCLEWSTSTYSCGGQRTCDNDTCVCWDECSSGETHCDSGDADLLNTCTEDSYGCWYFASSSCSGQHAGATCGGGECICELSCTLDDEICYPDDTDNYYVCDEYSSSGCKYWSRRSCASGSQCIGSTVCTH